MGESGSREELASRYQAQVDLLEVCERDVLRLLGTGCSLRTVGRHLALSDSTIRVYVREIKRKLQLHSLEALRDRAVSLRDVLWVGAEEAAPAHPQHFSHQSRWLPDLKLSVSGPLGAACRIELKCKSLRDVADYLRDCPEQPGPAPDDPSVVIRHRKGTLGAKQALLVALAIEAGRTDLQLIVACYELRVVGESAHSRPATLPLAVCHLRYRSHEFQIAEPGAGSLLFAQPMSTVCVNPGQFATERVELYQKMAFDWCRALDLKPNAFARLRAEQLRRTERRSVFEDLLGYRLPPNCRRRT